MTLERILIVGTLGGGGIHQYVQEQQRHLQAHVDVSIYDMYSEPLGNGVAWFLRSLALSLLAAVRFPLRSRPDVVHVHCSHGYSFVRASFYVLFATHVWRRPVVLHIHGSSFDEFVEDGSRVLEGLRASAFDAASAVVVLSRYWQETLEGPVPRDRLRVIPNAVNTDSYTPEFDVSRPHVVFLSSLVPRKGVSEFVEAIDELRERADGEFRVTVAGDGPLAADVESLAARRDNVTYLGYVSEAEKRELFESSSIYVLPTYAEGLPIAMLEAMAGGNAVVSTPVGAIPEVVGSENGALVDVGDADALADALAALVDDPEAVEAMARRNRALACERHDWDVIVESLLSIYEDVTSDDQEDVSDRRLQEAPGKTTGPSGSEPVDD